MKSGIWIKIALGVVVLFFVTLIGGYFWTKSYIRSDEFRQIVTRQLEQKVGGRVELSDTTWDGWTLNNHQIQVSGAKSFNELMIERLSLEIDPRGFFDRVWRVSDLHIREMEVNLGLKEVSRETVEPTVTEAVEMDWKDAGKSWLPRKAEVETLRVDNFYGQYVVDALTVLWQDTDLLVNQEGNDFLFKVSRGNLNVSKAPSLGLEIKALQGRIKPDSFYLNKGEFSDGGGAQMTLSGEGDFDGSISLQGAVRDLPVEKVLEEDWKQRVSGEVHGNYTYEQVGGTQLVSGSVRLEGGVLTALPVLDEVAKKTGISRFRQIAFDTCKCDYTVRESDVKLKNIELESRGFIRATGSFSQNDHRGEGTFELGLDASIIAQMPPGTAEVFKRQEGAYYYAPVQLSKVNGVWKDDLTPRLVVAVVKSLVTGQSEKGKDVMEGLKSLFGEKPADGGGDQNELLEKGSKIIEQGAKSLFDLLGN